MAGQPPLCTMREFLKWHVTKKDVACCYDAVQDTFVRSLSVDKSFRNEEHENT